MVSELIHDRGRGPEIAGTRITVCNLLPSFLDPAATEADLCRIYELTHEQVDAARAYVLNHPETVLAGHLKIEDRMAAGQPPEVIEQAKRTHAIFVDFQAWLAGREQTSAREPAAGVASDVRFDQPPTFREWLAERESRRAVGWAG